MNDTLLLLLDRLAKIGEENDARETARPKRMLNITRDTGRLLWILVRAMGATRILEVGTSNAFSTIWLAYAALSTGGRVTTLELNPEKIALARANLATAGLEGGGRHHQGTCGGHPLLSARSVRRREGAKANGVRSIGVTWGYGSREELEGAGADHIVSSVPELLVWLGAV